MAKNNSTLQRSFNRFLKNRSAIVGLIIIAFAIIIAILGYSITPDSTADANDQILQITNKQPGFKVTILQKRKNKLVEEKSFFHNMLYGKENIYELIPINSYLIKNDSILINEYTGSDSRKSYKSFLLADIIEPLNSDNFNYSIQKESISFIVSVPRSRFKLIYIH